MQQKLKICLSCGKETKIFSKKVCQQCWNKLYRKPIKPTTRKIKHLSKKGTKRLTEYQALRDEYLETHKVCEVCKSEPATEIHHKALRAGDNLFKHFLAVCRRCHQWIHAHPVEARENGYLLSHISEK